MLRTHKLPCDRMRRTQFSRVSKDMLDLDLFEIKRDAHAI
jgi:hypothetical protein